MDIYDQWNLIISKLSPCVLVQWLVNCARNPVFRLPDKWWEPHRRRLECSVISAAELHEKIVSKDILEILNAALVCAEARNERSPPRCHNFRAGLVFLPHLVTPIRRRNLLATILKSSKISIWTSRGPYGCPRVDLMMRILTGTVDNSLNCDSRSYKYSKRPSVYWVHVWLQLHHTSYILCDYSTVSQESFHDSIKNPR